MLFQGRLDAHAAREPFENSRRLGAGDANVLARYSLYSARIGRKHEATELCILRAWQRGRWHLDDQAAASATWLKAGARRAATSAHRV